MYYYQNNVQHKFRSGSSTFGKSTMFLHSLLPNVPYLIYFGKFQISSIKNKKFLFNLRFPKKERLQII